MDVALEGVDKLTVELQEMPSRVTRAIFRALNRGINSGRTVAGKEISNDTGMPSSKVRGNLTVREATQSRLSASLSASLKRTKLIDWSARGPEPSRGKGRGVSYRLGGSKGRAPHAFIATMPSGHRGVFERTSKKRLHIRELEGPSLGHVLEKYRAVVEARAVEMFQKNFDSEMGFSRTEDAGAD